MTMKHLTRLAAPLALALVASAVLAQPKIPPRYKADPGEVAQLPKYCYNQYVDGALQGYEFSIPHESCGPMMNHFCPALVLLMQAQRQSWPKNQRVGALRSAVSEIDYTLHDMKPGCFIANDVLQAKERAKVMSRFIK